MKNIFAISRGIALVLLLAINTIFLDNPFVLFCMLKISGSSA